MHKRGMSPIIITVLIILLALGSVTIIYTAIRPLLTDTGDKTTSGGTCLALDVVPVQCTIDGTEARVLVERRAGQGTFAGITFSFETPVGQKLVKINEHLDALESRTFAFQGTDVGQATEVDVGLFLAGGTTCLLTGSPIQCTSEEASSGPACSDGIDNEPVKDGWIDEFDPGCLDSHGVYNPLGISEANTPLFQCSDGVENDGEGDGFDGNDPDCDTYLDNNESQEMSLPLCGDNKDNDGDSWIDLDDPDCLQGIREEWYALTECQDGLDNDRDGHADNDDGQCEGAMDRNERDLSSGPACMNGRDDDGDGLIDYGIDPGCSSEGDGSEDSEGTSHQFSFYVNPSTTQFVRLNWTDSGGVVQHIVQWKNDPDNEYLLHSSKSHAGGNYSMMYGDDPLRYTQLGHADLKYTFLSQQPDGFTLRMQPADALPQAFAIEDTIRFRGDVMYWVITATNLRDEATFMRIPFFFSGLALGNLSAESSGGKHTNSSVSVLFPNSGDVIRTNFSSNGYGTLTYPSKIGTVSPVMAMWDYNVTIGQQALSAFYGYDLYAMRPAIYTGSRQLPVFWSYLETELDEGESRTFTFAYRLSASGDWSSTLQPYKQWFDYAYGSQPVYCPERAFSYSIGYNAPEYNSVSDHYQAGTNLTNLFKGDPSFMAQRGIARGGLWASAIHSRHITAPDSECQDPPVGKGNFCEFSSMIDLLDPSISASRNRSKIDDYSLKLRTAGIDPFFFARPCNAIYGADIQFDAQGNPLITRGIHSGYEGVNLLNVTNRDAYLARMGNLTERGIGGFYFDAMGCPGAEAFLSYAKKLDPEMYVVMEGFRDRSSLYWGQIPFPKPGSSGGTYDPNYNLIMKFISPLATYYGGGINNVLDDDAGETDDFLARGGQVILGAHAFTLQGFQQDVDQGRDFCRFLEKSYENQHALWASYGQGLGCDEPRAPSACPV